MAIYFNNPYNPYNNPYVNTGATAPAYDAYAPTPARAQQTPAMPRVMEWVEGEIGAKAYQMPYGWPTNQPIPLWDSTDMVIYLKSWNQYGMPNPLQKIQYTMTDQIMPGLPMDKHGHVW